jgi:glucose/mannose-6-phosphate isomerase
MEEAILKFAEQFLWKPTIENSGHFRPFDRAIVCGMGGSHLATGILKMWKPGIDVYVHRDYGLPPFSDDFLKNSLLIASSHSGNTEEVVDFLKEGYARGLSIVVIATGGFLIDFAKENNLPYIQIPNTGIQPRTAVGYSLVAITKFLNINPLAIELENLSHILKPESLREEGDKVAGSLRDKIPVIYASTAHLSLVYNWKIKMNETAKVPAFYNVFPELNHNEMTGFDMSPKTKEFSQKCSFVFIRDSVDHPQIQKRMDVCESLYEERGLSVTSLYLSGETILEKVFNSILLADWTALSLSKYYKTEAEQVPMVEEFKKRIA